MRCPLQVAVSLVLLIAAVLFVRSFWKLATPDLGFREKGIVLVSLDFSRVPQPRAKDCKLIEWTEERAAAYERHVLDELQSLPQVQSAGTSTHTPLDGSGWTLSFHLSGEKGESKFTWVSRGYFPTMRKRMLAGRLLSARDTPSSQRVAVVN